MTMSTLNKQVKTDSDNQQVQTDSDLLMLDKQYTKGKVK